MIPDWQLPPGVDRGLWDYLHSGDMVRGYDEQMAVSPLVQADVAFCETAFPTPGRLLDLGCGTGRLCLHFARKGYECVGVDLSDEMLAKAAENAAAGGVRVEWRSENITDLSGLPAGSFDYAACLFSTLGMVRGRENRAKVVANAFRLLKPGGRFVLHVHNRFFHGLGWRRVLSGWRGTGDLTMSQAYAGAPLTLHHFTRRTAAELLREAGFHVRDVSALGTDGRRARWPVLFRAYGYLLLADVPLSR
jgi:SAM-dependent methyltransferase